MTQAERNPHNPNPYAQAAQAAFEAEESRIFGIPSYAELEAILALDKAAHNITFDLLDMEEEDITFLEFEII